MSKDSGDRDTLHQGKHLHLHSRKGWEFVVRPNAKGVVAVLAVTDDRFVVLTEQFRPPVGRKVIELPAGLAGDLPTQEDEPLVTAAKRELLEETGYEAKNWTRLTEGPSSAGLTSEVITFFHATGLTRIGDGGGVRGEDIKVHFIPIADVKNWCEKRERDGVLTDFKIYAALYLARSLTQLTEARLWY
ncbi:MAG: NUDIX hydrolase [Verrucomicrobiae bacterium]|nr:NUDIX hydrolase [Verrucomicrobiae bacterium]MCP5541152.1 NUDIX hydrolase [Akkermansiaceae bacterium]MCP5551273.1 NUDIX hydrolase [Akkermansiaceae bacterium]